MIELFVSQDGTAAGDGTALRPYATLDQAQEALRRLRISGGAGPATVWLKGGTYRLARSFTLEADDGGTPDAPVSFRALPGKEVRISGGVALGAEAFRPVTDAQLLARLAPHVRGSLVQADLAALGIGDTGGRTPYGFAFPEIAGDLDLYESDRPLPLARWPREGYATTGEVLDAGSPMIDPATGVMGSVDAVPRGGTFKGDADRIQRWSQPRNLIAFGMWARDWAPATIPIGSLDRERGLITLQAPSFCGILQAQRYCVMNALEEIDQPGDWAVDRESRTLYLLPPGPLSGLHLEVSALTEPLLQLRGARHVVIRDLILECSRGHAVVIEGKDNLVAGCTFRNLGGRGINIRGTRNKVQACHVYSTGQGGILLSGGDRRTLTPAENVAENNEIHDFNRVCKTYNSAVWPMGCGQRIVHNLIYDGPHNAILLHGNDHVIEHNEFHHLAQDTDDASAIYSGRNPSEQGNVIRYNYFHHIGTASAWGTSAIYPDDGQCGLTIRGNVFYRCGHAGQVCMGAIFNNGGKDHTIENNIFVDCRIAYGLMLPLQAEWEKLVRGEDEGRRYFRSLYEHVNIRSDTYLRRYPWLADLASNAASNTVRRNLAVRCGVLVTPEDRQRVENNWMTQDDPGFEDLERLNFSLKPDAAAFRHIPGFEPVPFAKMGLRIDEYRRSLPERAGIDCRPEIVVRPEVSRPGGKARATLALHLANESARPVSADLELWTSHPALVAFASPRCSVTVPPRGTARREVELEVTVRPDASPAVGARVPGSVFSLPAPVRPTYSVRIGSRRDVPSLGSLVALLREQAPLPFLSGERTVGELRLLRAGAFLAVHASLADARGVPPVPEAGMWGGPYLGLLVAPAGASDAAEVRQPIFFPHGSGGAGTLWFFDGHRQVDPAPAIAWRTDPADGGWALSALVPAAALGLAPGAASFRLEAMANLTAAPDGKPGLVTLFGSKPARLELETLATVTEAG